MSNPSDVSLGDISLSIRAQLLKSACSRAIQILRIHCEGYLLILSEQVDEVYIKLKRLIRDIVESNGFENLATEFPKDFPESLHSMSEDADVYWEYIQTSINEYMGLIIQFCVEVGAKRDENLEAILFKNCDEFIDNFRREKKLQDRKFIEGVSQSTSNKLESTQQLFPIEIFQGTRGYIERVAKQANGCYVSGWYDACAVMIRRLIETLIIECFESHGIDSKIIKPTGDFESLEILVAKFIGETSWNIGRTTRKSLDRLPKFKGICDLSAHNRRFIAKKEYIDDFLNDARLIVEEMISLAFKK